MLAQEAYWSLVDKNGADAISLVTGEEKINEGAPIVCCTAEMAPRSGELLLLDEVQWAIDPERGSAWTSLLLEKRYQEYRLMGSLDAVPLIRSAFPEAEVRFHDRLAPLDWVGTVAWKELQPKTAIIAFSRRNVLWLAGLLARSYSSADVSVLYGAMPPDSRRAQIKRFIDGEAKFIVSTDVIGHGINMPAQTVLFAETEKFNGYERVQLAPWEAAQIAGRAGRYGMHDGAHGQVGVLIAPEAYLTPFQKTIRRGMSPKVDIGDGKKGFRSVEFGYLRPRLGELEVSDNNLFFDALKKWEKRARKRQPGWVRIEKTGLMRQRLQLVRQALGGDLNQLDQTTIWKLARAPVDPDSDQTDTLVKLTRCLDKPEQPYIYANLLPDRKLLGRLEAEDVEAMGRRVQLLLWFMQSFPGQAPWEIDEVREAEEAVSKRLLALIKEELKHPTIGRCQECGTQIAPWFRDCYSCHFGGGRYWDEDDWDDF